MSEPYKIRVKLGANEFDAEGPEEVVKDQFQLFLEAVKQPVAPTPPPPAASGGNGNGGSVASKIDAEILKRLYVVEAGNNRSFGMSFPCNESIHTWM